jgi:hypothetical protein
MVSQIFLEFSMWPVWRLIAGVVRVKYVPFSTIFFKFARSIVPQSFILDPLLHWLSAL